MRLFWGSSLVVVVLMAIASAAGLLADDLYRDNALVESGWLGNDLVTLVLAVPLMVGAMKAARRGSPTGLLLCLGMLAYAAYNYAFYVFGAAFNRLFLVHVSVLAFATLGLIAGLASESLRRHAEHVRVRGRDRSVGWLVFMIALLLGFFWVGSSVAYVVTDRLPSMIIATGHPTNIAGALDLWLVVTFGLLGGSWLASGRVWGLILAAIWTVKGAVYMLTLSAASFSAYWNGSAGDLLQLSLWMPIGIVCAGGALVLLRPAGRPEWISRRTTGGASCPWEPPRIAE